MSATNHISVKPAVDGGVEFFDGADFLGGLVKVELPKRAKPATPAAAPLPTDVDTWPELAIPGRDAPPALTPDLLPTWLGEMAAAVSFSTETPTDMAVLFCLGIVALCVQGRYVVAPKGDDYEETLSLFIIVAMLSGSRKSGVVNLLKRVLDEWMKNERLAMLRDVVERNHEIKALDDLIERKRRDLARLDDLAERKRALAEITDLESGRPDELHYPELYATDATPESLPQKLADQGERFGVLSAEGVILSILAGLYSGKGRANNDLILGGHAGDSAIIHRAGRKPIAIRRAAICMVLAIQPGILCEAAENPQFRHSGLLARFLPAMPAGNIGKRDVRRSSAIDPGVKARYEAGILGLLKGRPNYAVDPQRIEFTGPAREAWFDFAEEIEREQGDGRRFESVRDWTGKLPGQVARIAALIELAGGGRAEDGVSLQSVERAVEIGRRLIGHAMAMFGMIGANEKDADALAVLRWVKANDLREFDRTDLYRAHEARFGGNTERATVAIKRLVEWGVLRHYRIRPAKESKGGRPRDLLLVNPQVFAA
ncbi:MAG: YfjI family protein [Rhodocyclaceae bacterium]|nr:YfjI family protein [Rhodocyclaceae bacterium]